MKKGYRNPYSAQMGSVFMNIKTRNKMETETPAHQLYFSGPKPILPAPPAKVFDTRSLKRIMPDVMRDAIYREQQAFDNKIRQLNEPILPSLEAERLSKQLFYAKVANLEAQKRRQLAQAVLTPEQYLEQTNRYRSEFDTLANDASLTDLIRRYQDAGLPAPPVNLSNTRLRDPAEYIEALRGIRASPETGVNVPQLPPTTAQRTGAPANAQRTTRTAPVAPVTTDIDEIMLRAFEEGTDPDRLRAEAEIERARQERTRRELDLVMEARLRQFEERGIPRARVEEVALQLQREGRLPTTTEEERLRILRGGIPSPPRGRGRGRGT